MANVLNKNPIVLDTAGATSAITSRLEISTIVVTPGDDTWAVLLLDGASGDTVLDITGTVAASGPVVIPFGDRPLVVSGLYAETLTDIDNVSVYISAGSAI